MNILIIDAYNVIYAMPELEELLNESLEAARIGLVRMLIELKEGRGDIERITVVFDGREEHADEEASVAPGIMAVYTHTHKEADRKIIEIIEDSPNPAEITVISNDNYLYNNVRAHGARVKSVQQFSSML